MSNPEVIPVVVKTDEGDRLSPDGARALAVSLGLLDAGPPFQFAHQALIEPANMVINYAEGIFNALAFQKENEKTALQADHVFHDEAELLQHVEHLIRRAKASGLGFSVNLTSSGEMVPATHLSKKMV